MISMSGCCPPCAKCLDPRGHWVLASRAERERRRVLKSTIACEVRIPLSLGVHVTRCTACELGWVVKRTWCAARAEPKWRFCFEGRVSPKTAACRLAHSSFMSPLASRALRRASERESTCTLSLIPRIRRPWVLPVPRPLAATGD